MKYFKSKELAIILLYLTVVFVGIWYGYREELSICDTIKCILTTT